MATINNPANKLADNNNNNLLSFDILFMPKKMGCHLTKYYQALAFF